MASPVNAARQFAAMEFPPYVFREYPKALKLPDGTIVEVANAKAELDALANFNRTPEMEQKERERQEELLELERMRSERDAMAKELAAMKAMRSPAAEGSSDAKAPVVLEEVVVKAEPVPTLDAGKAAAKAAERLMESGSRK